MEFRCYHCSMKFVDLASVIGHCASDHDEEVLRYRQLALCEESGLMKYQTKLHEGLVPRRLNEIGKMIQVRDTEVFVFDAKSKKKKLNTPVKGKEVRRALLFNDSQIEFNESQKENQGNPCELDEPEKDNDLPDIVEQMSALLPSVIDTLQEEGQLDSYVKFNNLLASQDFPTKNICYLLFLDLVEWFSCDNTSRMRYRPETVKFWQIGYRLFHGKFLRFMSGLRNFGQILDGSSERGIHDPTDSKLNFAVPSRNNLYSKKDEKNLFYPGINTLSIETLVDRVGSKPMKLSVDGKKICRGKGKKLGDIDCWGYENKPTLQERQEIHKTETLVVESMQKRLDRLEEKGLTIITTIPALEKSKIRNDLKVVVGNLAKNNKLLREKSLSLEQMEIKFKKLGGQDWKNSRFYPVVCSVRVANVETKKQIEDSLVLTNKLSLYGAQLCNNQETFCNSDRVVMSDQQNFYQINSNLVTDDTRLIPQRSDKWFNIRKTAMVTGSTCNKALGLGTLKQQEEHFDSVVNKVEKASVSEDVQRRMEFGTLHEIDAVATVTAKVLPFLYPEYSFFEEGCMQVPYKDQPSFMVVSPDGSFRKTRDGPALMMYENKCKAPNSFSPSAYYKIPDYYVVQLLSEMHAYGCSELMFTCWAEQSMTVFHVVFDAVLWKICWDELTRLYGDNTKKHPTRVSPIAKGLKGAVKKFTEKNVTLLAEYPSCTAVMPSPRLNDCDISKPYLEPNISSHFQSNISLTEFQESLVITKTWFDDTYRLLRSVASEILVFMVNDLDRMYDMELSNAHPVAYALKGPSMKADVFRNMTDDVISHCEGKGLCIVVTASDGQWHQYGVRDSDAKPLTVHQLHRDHWSAVKAKDRSSILAEIKSTYKADTLDDINFERGQTGIVVHGHRRDSPLRIRQWCGEVENQCSENIQTEQGSEELTEIVCQDECVGLNINFENKTDEETNEDFDQQSGQSLQGAFTNELQRIAVESYALEEDISWLFETNYSIGQNECATDEIVTDPSTQNLNKTINVLQDAHDVIYGQYFSLESTLPCEQETDICMAQCRQDLLCEIETRPNGEVNTSFPDKHMIISQPTAVHRMHQTETTASNLESVPVENSGSKLFDDVSYESMLSALQNDGKAMQTHDWSLIDRVTFSAYFSSKESMMKHFQKYELSLCLQSISESFIKAGIAFRSRWPKYRLIQFVLEHNHAHVQISHVPVPLKLPRKRFKVASLKKLCANVVTKFSKETLMSILAENKWDNVLTDWQNAGPIPTGITVENVIGSIQWFSQPSVGNDGKIRFHFTDACHILTCLRTKICTTGISGLRRKAWEMAALSDKTALNISVVVDCVDKQDVSLARRLFSKDVEDAMGPEYQNEANFCRLIRQWFDAEDEPSVSAAERCKRRIALRNWLLQGYRIGKFPPHTRYVRGIPIITFEGLVANIERKLQLYAFVPGSMYNVRATGSQEVENFFSTFRDLEPTGKGIPKPDIIPEMMSAVAEVDNFRLNPEKPFYMKTSRASVYPYEPFLPHFDSETSAEFLRLPSEASCLCRICPRDHFFDRPERDTRRHRRPTATISRPDEPARGEQGVRQYFVRDDTKINAVRRMGWLNLPGSSSEQNDSPCHSSDPMSNDITKKGHIAT